MRELANEVTTLEDEIHRYGSVTVKQPDVWGDADLMGYIQEYEQVMINRLTDFKDTIQGYIARSDQSDLQSMTALGFNAGPAGGAIPTPFSNFTAANGANSAVTPANVTTTATGAAQQGQVFDVLNQALSQSERLADGQVLARADRVAAAELDLSQSQPGAEADQQRGRHGPGRRLRTVPVVRAGLDLAGPQDAARLFGRRHDAGADGDRSRSLARHVSQAGLRRPGRPAACGPTSTTGRTTICRTPR